MKEEQVEEVTPNQWDNQLLEKERKERTTKKIGIILFTRP